MPTHCFLIWKPPVTCGAFYLAFRYPRFLSAHYGSHIFYLFLKDFAYDDVLIPK